MRGLGITSALGIVGLLACSGDDPTAVEDGPVAQLEIILDEYGDGVDGDGDGVRVWVGSTAFSVPAGTTSMAVGLPPGTYETSVEGAAGNCTATVDRGFITLLDGGSTSLEVALRCGGRLAFTATQAGGTDLRYMDEKGAVHLLSGPEVDVPSFRWSPDGTRLAFSRRTGSGFDIYTVRYDGSELVRLTESPGDDLNPSWSPSGGELTFLRVEGDSSGVWIASLDGAPPRQLTSGSHSTEDKGPRWSPEGGLIVFVARPADGFGRPVLWVVSSDGSGLRQLGQSGTVFLEPEWSPDGRSLAVGSSAQPGWKLDVVSSDFADWAQVATSGQAVFTPAWSPTGDRLAYTKHDGNKFGAYLLDLGSGVETRITPVDQNRSSPVWSQDGRHAYFLGSQATPTGGSVGAVFAVNLDGTAPAVLTTTDLSVRLARPQPR
jgi:Tol biopolymer transport system component